MYYFPRGFFSFRRFIKAIKASALSVGFSSTTISCVCASNAPLILTLFKTGLGK
jgi:hypothetical protein